MSIAISILFNNNLYYLSFAEDREIVASERYGADICIPEMKESVRARWDGTQINLMVEANGHTHQLKMPLDQMTHIDGSSAVIYASRASRSCFSMVLPQDREVRIGRSKVAPDGKFNDIAVNLPILSDYHFRIVCGQSGCIVYDESNHNKLYLNGKAISTGKLHEGDVLSVFTFHIILINNKLYFSNVSSNLIEPVSETLVYHQVAVKEQIHDGELLYRRSPRLVTNVAQQIIELEKPPQAGGLPQINWLNVLLTPAISIGLMVVLVITMGLSPVMLIMSGVMTVVSTTIAIINYFRQKKRHNQHNELIDSKYRAYLEETRAELEMARKQQKNNLLQANPSPAECLSIADNRTRRLWERSPVDLDYLHVRLGLGAVESAVSAYYHQPHVVIEENPLEAEAKTLVEEYKAVSNVPILSNLSTEKMLGVIGNRSAEIQLVCAMVTELCTAHSYDELKIIALVPKNELDKWEWLRWLPHCMDGERQKRYVFTSIDDAETALIEFEEMLSQRKTDDAGSGDVVDAVPHLLFIAAKPGMIEKHTIRTSLYSEAKLGCTTLLLYDRLGTLPLNCKTIVEVETNLGHIYSKQNSAQKVFFIPDAFTSEEADRFARSLAPLYTETEGSAASLPNSISFLAGYGVSTPEELDIGQRWEQTKTYKSLSVPIAALPGGDPFCFDIHEKRHGVNGVVAGMPGSGKTEMVQSWLLSLAVNFSPQDLSFVLIDFKGTGMIAPFRNLPHLAGSISNLDTDISRNLLAIQSEVHRREKLIDKYSDENVKNINDLNKCYAQGLIPERLPVLLIVIDEYAEFKKVFPDFGAEIDSLTSKGRALGIFVVLMTQKPAGVVTAKTEDNIKFRWCLRVANFAASREILGNRDAARLNNPGRAYVKVGEGDVYELVQSYWSGAPYAPDNGESAVTHLPISTVALNGTKKSCEQNEKQQKSNSTKIEIDVITDYITDFCIRNQIPSAQKVWTEKLPEQIGIHEVLSERFNGTVWPGRENAKAAVGLVDDPGNQKQYPLILDLSETGHLVIYGAPVTGKTTLLQTVIMSHALTRRPDEVSIYIMDFGGWNLNVMKGLPHVGGVANDNEPERLKKLVVLLTELMDERKMKFSRAGVSGINAYREATGEQIPDILLVVDNFGPVMKLYPEMDSFFSSLTGSGANYGMYLIAAAGSSNSVSHKISQNIKNIYAMQMIDKSDFTYLVGKVGGNLPNVMGRGYAKGTPPLMFQTALPAPGETSKEISDNIRRISSVMCERWSGALPRPIPEMPERIPYGSVKTAGIALGLSSEKVLPVVYDHTRQHYLFISGTVQSGKSNLLQAVSRQILEKEVGTLLVFDVKGSLPALKPIADTYLRTAAEIDAFVEELRQELQERYAQKQADPGAVFSPIIFAIDDYSRFFAAVSNDTISRLLAVLKIGTGLGLYLIVADDSYGAASLINKGEAVSSTMAHGKQLVLLGGCMNDHMMLTVKANYTQKSEVLKEHEGYFVINGDHVRFKAIHNSEEA